MRAKRNASLPYQPAANRRTENDIALEGHDGVVWNQPGSNDDDGMKTSPTVWVCIAVFNRIGYTRKCLELLRTQSYRNIRPVVVDDGSSDGTSDMIEAEHPEVALIRGDGSLYWTGAMHLGIEHILVHAGAKDRVLLLNDDLVFDADFVEKLLHVSQLRPRALIQALESCIQDPDLIWQGGVRVNFWTAKHHAINHHRRISEFSPEHIERSDYLTGRGLLVPIEAIRISGNFDATYRQYGDPEFSHRAAKNGYELLVCYGVRVLSYEKGKNLNEAEAYSLSDLKRYYFSILSSARLSIRWKNATSMTNSIPQALVFFFSDFIRITVHFFKRLKLRLPATS